MEKRLVVFLLLSAVIFFGWSYIYTKLYPPPPPTTTSQNQEASASPTATAAPTPNPVQQATTPPSVPLTQATVKQIKVKTDHWVATLSNQGGVITEWTMTNFPDGKMIDAPTGVNLISSQLSQQIGAPFRFYIPSDNALEKELNSAAFEIKDVPEQEIFLNKGEKREITFVYANNNGIEASKTLIFKGLGRDGSSGFDFDFQASVKRNGNPIEAYIAIGPNFGDQSVKEISTYKHAPQLTYAAGSVKTNTADSLKQPATPTPSPVSWAAVDDNYFALTIVPPIAVPAVELVNDKKVSIAVLLRPNEPYRVYAGPKDLKLLKDVSTLFGLDIGGGRQLEDIINYGILDWIGLSKVVKPIAQFMLWALREINKVTRNFGWSIVVLTILLNMVFFPLRWKSSAMMKKSMVMQPKMKELQDRIKKLDKNDPRMPELQKEMQTMLMNGGTPLLGCLPMLLQMPFFVAVFAVLTVSIEVRHAHFFGWLTDLSAKDPVHILPIVMCVTMILQTALMPSPASADPMQKRIQYLMPPILTFFFFWSAPAGLVLYWMVGNIVGIGQQFVINRLTPNPPPATDESTKGKPTQQPSKKGKKTRQAVANS